MRAKAIDFAGALIRTGHNVASCVIHRQRDIYGKALLGHWKLDSTARYKVRFRRYTPYGGTIWAFYTPTGVNHEVILIYPPRIGLQPSRTSESTYGNGPPEFLCHTPLNFIKKQFFTPQDLIESFFSVTPQESKSLKD